MPVPLKSASSGRADSDRAVRVRLAVWISVLALLTAVAPLATDMYLPALPAVGGDLHTSAAMVQVTLTATLVGLAIGQLVIGPFSDAWGRRGLLLVGSSLFVAASVGCAVAPSVVVLVALRFVQGCGGAAGIVLSRAVITDREVGSRAVRLFSVMMAINGIAPVLAPLLGSTLLAAIGWREVFVVLTVLGLVMVGGVLVAVPESLPRQRRVSGGVRRAGRGMLTLLGRRNYLGYTAVFALSFAMMFAYISGSPFVLQQRLGLSTLQYAAAFGLNATGLGAASLLGGKLTMRISPRRQLTAAVSALVVLGLAFLVVVLVGMPRWPALGLLFLVVTALGFVLGNSTALASLEAQDMAGVGSALLGALQFGLGALVSPLVGSSPVLMAALMLTAAVLAALALIALVSRHHDPSTS